ncbi:hypothetical protein Rhopal_005324-T1 [Rhodotorula paludigena]|uniref:Uncharacterized protein n=1 Tax=Rhodotorula paludigena TaxID=86838 RepID=A0AAV5GQV2_9BASI|nr:hypothetical protein Rhopal_005324-T1 [Rhodotorula paludigena]
MLSSTRILVCAAALALVLSASLGGAVSPHSDHDSLGKRDSDGHSLLARQRGGGRRGRGSFGGGGFGNPFNRDVSRAPQVTDNKLNPGNTDGQNQGADQQGTGNENVNQTSGLPANIVDTGDPQRNLFLDPSQIAVGLANDGQDVPAANQVASATSTNNFINSCLLRTDLPLTNGNQVTGGSCNAVPMGVIAAQNRMPSSKFVSPKNLDVIPPNQDFTIQMAINNLETGNFVNAQQNYYSAPQATNAQGIIVGHSHVVVEQIDSLTSTQVTDPTQFAFFQGLNLAAVNGILSASVSGGLPEGVYRVASNDPNALQAALGLNNAAVGTNNTGSDAAAGQGQAQQNGAADSQQQGAGAGNEQAQQQVNQQQQGVDAASTTDAASNAATSSASAAGATTSAAAAAASTGGAQQQQQQRGSGRRFGGGRNRFGGRSLEEKRFVAVPRSDGEREQSRRSTTPESRLEKRLEALLAAQQ